MTYKSLKELFHADRSNERSDAGSAFRTGVSTKDGELLLAVPRKPSVLQENVLRFERRISRLAGELPPVAIGPLIRDPIITEIVSTNELQGMRSTRRQINAILEMHRKGTAARKEKSFASS